MSKKTSDGDVLSNKFSLFQANQQRLLASLIGPKTEAELSSEKEREEKEDADYKDESLGYERLGFGAQIPKEIQDGSFTRRNVSSNDKLLAQLIGSKAAKAHIAAKQAPQNVIKPQSLAKPSKTAKLQESDDEEESRATMFKSKRRKPERNAAHSKPDEVSEDAQDPEAIEKEEISAPPAKKVRREDDSEAENEGLRARSGKSKPGSYLDEILAERSKKKKNKNKGNIKT